MLIQTLKSDLKSIVLDLGYKIDDIVIYIPQNSGFGDYATNMALQLSKQKLDGINHSAIEIANRIVKKLAKKDYLEKIEIVPPGFINYFIKQEVFKKELFKIKTGFAANESGAGKKVILEHTSVNPNKAMHIGHLRNAVIGDTLARILKRNGFVVEVQNYIDDTGVQVADSFIAQTNKTKFGFRDRNANESIGDYLWELYAQINRKYEENPELLNLRAEVLRQLEDWGSETAKEAKRLAEEIVQETQQLLAKFGIWHNLYVWESDILKFGFWQKAFEILKKTPRFEQETQGKNKGTWLVRFDNIEGEYDLDKIFVRSDGTATYVAKDFAYNLWKFSLLGQDFLYSKFASDHEREIYSTDFKGEEKRGFAQGDLVYTVIDERQSYPQQVIMEVFQRLGFQKQAENFKHIAYGVVTLSARTAKELGIMLSQDKTSYAMSGRKGIGVKVGDLLSLLRSKIAQEIEKREVSSDMALKIASSALRYFMIKYNSLTEIVFDFDQALSLYGETGPYLQYTYARLFSILEKAKDLKIQSSDNYLPNPDETTLIKDLLEWPSLISEAGKSLEPSAIATFAFNLAQNFNTFYERNKVLGAKNEAEKAFRLGLIKKFEIVFKDVLDTLGIEALRRM